METLWLSTPEEVQSESVCLQSDCFCFGDSEGEIMIDYLEKRKTINGQYFVSESIQLKEAIKSRHADGRCVLAQG